MRTLSGTPASSGVARGPWVRIDPPREPQSRAIAPEEVRSEQARLTAASRQAAEELAALAGRVTADGHPDEGAIFEAQAQMAVDPALLSQAEQAIEERHVDAVGAVLAVGRDLAAQLRGLGDELLSARAADVGDVAARIARRAAGIADGVAVRMDVPSLVVAEDLPPSVTATLPRDRLLGFALESGSATAHAAILARAYGIPAIVGVAGLLDALAESAGGAGRGAADLAIDGGTGEVFIDPDPATAEELARRSERSRRADEEALHEASLPVVTADGVEITLLANIGTPEEAPRAVALGARGVGLFRTEFLFLERPTEPSEDEQLSAYRAAVEAFAPYPVTIRLLDVGGDKPIPYLPMAPEANPFLGVRALRLAATRPGIFLTQLRAAMRAALAGPVKVMAPMVADAEDAETLLALAAEARAELEARGVAFAPVELGVMLEIPGAILVGDSYFPRLAFASLGTNDLLQYTLAVDRGNPDLRRYQDSLHPALLRLVREAAAGASRAGIELSVCGEMAGDPVAALALVGVGIRKLSMAASSLAPVRRAIRAADASRLRAEAEAALAAGSAASVRAQFAALLGEHT
ncbi:MAG: phosphoenolpyruvate--protein phosphotransferase [Candidatus Limnocylindrales bacterium]